MFAGESPAEFVVVMGVLYGVVLRDDKAGENESENRISYPLRKRRARV